MVRLYLKEKMKSTLYRIAANVMPKFQTPMQQVFYSCNIKDIGMLEMKKSLGSVWHVRAVAYHGLYRLCK